GVQTPVFPDMMKVDGQMGGIAEGALIAVVALRKRTHGGGSSLGERRSSRLARSIGGGKIIFEDQAITPPPLEAEIQPVSIGNSPFRSDLPGPSLQQIVQAEKGALPLDKVYEIPDCLGVGIGQPRRIRKPPRAGETRGYGKLAADRTKIA